MELLGNRHLGTGGALWAKAYTQETPLNRAHVKKVQSLYHCCLKAEESEADPPVPLSPEGEGTETGRMGLLSHWRESNSSPPGV